jgi:hypothetical protein
MYCINYTYVTFVLIDSLQRKVFMEQNDYNLIRQLSIEKLQVEYSKYYI